MDFDQKTENVWVCCVCDYKLGSYVDWNSDCSRFSLSLLSFISRYHIYFVDFNFSLNIYHTKLKWQIKSTGRFESGMKSKVFVFNYIHTHISHFGSTISNHRHFNERMRLNSNQFASKINAYRTQPGWVLCIPVQLSCQHVMQLIYCPIQIYPEMNTN